VAAVAATGSPARVQEQDQLEFRSKSSGEGCGTAQGEEEECEPLDKDAITYIGSVALSHHQDRPPQVFLGDPLAPVRL
jgi:hypothetical protein